jgi:hypothetical protein
VATGRRALGDAPASSAERAVPRNMMLDVRDAAAVFVGRRHLMRMFVLEMYRKPKERAQAS